MKVNSDKTSDERNDAARQSACATGGATALVIYAVKDLAIGAMILSKAGWALPVVAVTMLTYAGAEKVADTNAQMYQEEIYTNTSLVGEIAEEV